MSELTFDEINRVVNSTFFDGRYRDRPVYLDLEGAHLEEIADELGGNSEEVEGLLGSTILDSLDWNSNNIYVNHHHRLLRWHQKDFDSPPPYTVVLLILSLAAEKMKGDDQYSANNYYRRLLEVLGGDDEEKRVKLSQSGKHTKLLWHALNLWLKTHDYAYGRPTAKKVNSWTYVSYALSQSLVRDADRKRFHKLFTRFSLSPYEGLGEAEMMLYVHEWMATPEPGKWLKTLWGSAELRERIASAALEELECSDTDELKKDSPHGIQKRLSWLAVLKTFPTARVNLFLGSGGFNGQEHATLDLDDNSSNAAKEAFENTSDIWLAPLPGSENSYLEPVNEIKIESLLQTPIKLKCRDSELKFIHDPRPVIPLIKVPGSMYFREVSRVGLHSTHAILCYEGWLKLVERHLSEYARPGFKVVKGNDVNGVVPDWVFISGVEILGSINRADINANLQVLVPLDEGVSIKVDGGLKLASGIWHTDAPPEVFASDEDGVLDVSFEFDAIKGTRKKLHVEKASDYDPGFIKHLGTELSGENFVVVTGTGNKKKEVHVSFRSSDTPRKRLTGKDRELAYPLGGTDETGNCSNARDIFELEDSLYLRGMELSRVDPEGNVKLPGNIPNLSELKLGYEEEEYWLKYDTSKLKDTSESCILRGYHIWVCEPYVPGQVNSRRMECKGCHNYQIAPKRRGRRRGQTAYRSDIKFKQQDYNVAMQEQDRVSADTVVDAICYLGGGSWNSIESLFSSHVELPWQSREFGRNLVDLGIIDVEYSKNWGRPVYWSCPPPSIVVNEIEGIAFLAGFRNTKMIHQIDLAIGDICQLEVTPAGFSRPSAYKWKIGEITLKEIGEIVKGIHDPAGRQVAVVSTPTVPLLLALPGTSKILNSLESIYIEDSSKLEVFNLHSGKWREGNLEKGRAYRSTFRGRTYFYHEENGRSLVAGHELVKLLSARYEGTRLHGYNVDLKQFESVIGCTPPGLYRRALVSLSGSLPSTVDGKHVYTNVPMDIAGYIIKKLYH